MRYVNNYITIASNSLSFHFQKHPHLRGENPFTSHDVEPVMETSPPAWGKPGRNGARHPLRRNIPTCVGKTIVALPFVLLLKKHPHLRGENP